MPQPPRLLPAGDSAIVVEYGEEVDARVNAQVRRLHREMRARARPGIIETVPTYRSLMVHYDPLLLGRETVEQLLREALAGLPEERPETSRVVVLPVLYGGEAGPDLEDVAAHSGLSAESVIALHTSGDYLVFMLGFMPGFAYLGGLPSRIATPRLATPRTSVPAGSVGIAGAQTGIYPTTSPGGWRLIGRTPVRLFDARSSPPTLVEAGDGIRFVRVTQSEYDTIVREVAADAYRPVVHARSKNP